MNGNNERNTKSQRWIFTLNNPTPEEYDKLSSLFEKAKVLFIVFGRERGESGTPHFQGYLELSRRVRRRNVVALDGLQRARVEPAKGTATHNIQYCSKGLQPHPEWLSLGAAGPNFGRDSNVFVRGTPIPSLGKQGRRTDLEGVITDIRSGLPLRTIASNNPNAFIRYHAGIKRYFDITKEVESKLYHGPFPWPYPEDIRSIVLSGSSGIGKTCFAKFLLPSALFLSHMDSLGQYDPSTHHGIVFDDMCFTHLHREAQIHLLDFDEPRSIHIRYDVARIPAGTPKIFTTNRDAIFLEHEPAINRRVRYIFLK